MILSISSSLETFKRIEFHRGLNVLLSDTQPEASQKQTRNSAGKTSLIEIIHFLLGSNCDTKSIFRTSYLINHSFQGEFIFWGQKICIERSGSEPKRIYLPEGFYNINDLPIKLEKGRYRQFLSNNDWKTFLGHILFKLPFHQSGTGDKESFTPSFRSMLSYFIRRHNSRGFSSPERQAASQQIWDWQVNLSYLFDLDWQISQEFQKINARASELKELKKAAKGDVFGRIIGSVAKLRSEVPVAEKKAAECRTKLENFQVLDVYNNLAQRAAEAKNRMQMLTHETIGLRETLDYLELALASETPPDSSTVDQIYASAGVELPGVTLRHLDDVKRFFESVIKNRRQHLAEEISQITSQIKEKENVCAKLDSERQTILKTLESHGALEDFLELQKELAELEAEVSSLKNRFETAKKLEEEATQLDIDRSNLKQRLQKDFLGRKVILDEAILLVTRAISELYDDRKNRFDISVEKNGPKFKISIDGDRGGGIANMEIFCFDLALFKFNLKRHRGPGFLLHDSHLFDGVDGRQIARALALGAETSESEYLQYIVTMNSDIFDRLPLPEKIDRNKVVLNTRLSDKSESGGLFGFQFD